MTPSLLVDALIVVIALSAFIGGWRQGAASSVLSAIGVLAGLIIGLSLAPAAMNLSDSIPIRFLLVLGIVVVLASVGSLVGSILGFDLRERMRLRASQTIDSIVGAIFQVALAAVVLWLIAGPIAIGMGGQVADGIRGSTLLSSVNRVLPDSWRHAPDRISALLNESGLPPLVSPFDIVSPTVEPPPPEVSNPQLVEAVRPSVVNVLANAPDCQRRMSGSGFVAAQDYILTNAHVVAGARDVTLDTMLGAVNATVVFYEPGIDVAVLHAPGLGLAPLPWVEGPLHTAEEALALGFPLSGPFTASPTRVNDRITLSGPDIYANGRVEREAYVLRGSIREGNSGGPLIDASGRVAGMIFGASVEDTETGFALTAEQVLATVGDMERLQQPVSTKACVGS